MHPLSATMPTWHSSQYGSHESEAFTNLANPGGRAHSAFGARIHTCSTTVWTGESAIRNVDSPIATANLTDSWLITYAARWTSVHCCPTAVATICKCHKVLLSMRHQVEKEGRIQRVCEGAEARVAFESGGEYSCAFKKSTFPLTALTRLLVCQ